MITGLNFLPGWYVLPCHSERSEESQLLRLLVQLGTSLFIGRTCSVAYVPRRVLKLAVRGSLMGSALQAFVPVAQSDRATAF